MLSLKLAFKNLKTNYKYTLGLFAIFLAVAVLCVFFFLFFDLAQNAYSKMLSTGVSNSYVSLYFEPSETERLALDEAHYQQLSAISETKDLVIMYGNFEPNYFKVANGDSESTKIVADIQIVMTEDANIPEYFAQEYFASYEKLLLFGSEIDKNSEIKQCLVSEDYAELLAVSKEELVGQTLNFYDYFGGKVTGCQVVGVLSAKLGKISFMQDFSRYFIFMDDSEVSDQYIYTTFYMCFADYRDLDSVNEKLQALQLNVPRTFISRGEVPYSMKKLAQTVDFVSAVLALIAMLCIAVAVAFLTGAVLFRYQKAKTFYFAAFSVGLSKAKLLKCCLFEFFLVSIPAFVAAIPISLALSKFVARLVAVFANINFEITDGSLLSSLLALLPLAATAAITILILNKKLTFQKHGK